MSLRDIQLEDTYDSISNDLLSEFYVPVLSVANRYDRLTGFFSSTALASAARGIYHFLKNVGQMRVVMGSTIAENDLQAILSGEKNREDILSEQLNRELDRFPDLATENHVKALAWLISRDLLEIRIAHVLDEKGNIMPAEAFRGIFHMKVGILTDTAGRKISFSGSINETSMGWEHNYEEFKVFRDWVDGDARKVKADIEKFEDLWYGKSDRIQVDPVPEAFRKKLVSIAPENLSELKGIKSEGTIRLRGYQKAALENWFENDRTGILAMATGTGKTITAIDILKKLSSKVKPLLAVITVPFVHLISQWHDVLELYGFSAEIAQGSTSEWRNAIANRIFDLAASINDVLVILVTHASFYRKALLSLLDVADIPTMLIADEVHGLGSPQRRKGLVPRYDYRLGLSATPERYFDDEGTRAILEFFKGIVYEFPLQRAIEEGYLSHYDYHPIFVGLSSSEMNEYRELTKKVARAYYAAKNNKEAQEAFEQYCFLRQRVIRNAERKYIELTEILDDIEKKEFILVYCSPQQIDRVQATIGDTRPKLVQSRFTAEENRQEREDLLNSFAKGTHQILVAMKCLDEGVDVPATKYAIFMASTTNPRQFIQRRGRVLRPSPGKDKSVIYDIVVVPSVSSKRDEYFDLERSIVAKELDRCVEFLSAADNRKDCLKRVKEIACEYEIELEEENP